MLADNKWQDFVKDKVYAHETLKELNPDCEPVCPICGNQLILNFFPVLRKGVWHTSCILHRDDLPKKLYLIGDELLSDEATWKKYKDG